MNGRDRLMKSDKTVKVMLSTVKLCAGLCICCAPVLFALVYHALLMSVD